MATHIADGVLVTNFGQPPGGDKPTAIATYDKSALIGSVSSIPMTHDAQVAASQTNQVVFSFKAQSRYEIIGFSYWARAVAGTVSFNLYNLTDTAAVTGAVTPTTTAQDSNTFSSAAVQFVDNGDVLQLRVTTAGASTVDGLVVVLHVRNVDSAPDGV